MRPNQSKQEFFGRNHLVGAPEDNDQTESRGPDGNSKSNNYRLLWRLAKGRLSMHDTLHHEVNIRGYSTKNCTR